MPSNHAFDRLAPVMDTASALQRLGDDVELMDQIIEIFLEDAPALVHAAREALAAGDAVKLRRAAHSLKGMMGTLSAREGVNAALRMEQCAASGALEAASPLIHDCGQRVTEISQALQAYVDQKSRADNHDSTVPANS